MWSCEELSESASFNISIIRVVWGFFYLCALIMELKLFELSSCASVSCRDEKVPLMLYVDGKELIHCGAGHSYLEVGGLTRVSKHVVISSCKQPEEV